MRTDTIELQNVKNISTPGFGIKYDGFTPDRDNYVIKIYSLIDGEQASVDTLAFSNIREFLSILQEPHIEEKFEDYDVHYGFCKTSKNTDEKKNFIFEEGTQCIICRKHLTESYGLQISSKIFIHKSCVHGFYKKIEKELTKSKMANDVLKEEL